MKKEKYAIEIGKDGSQGIGRLDYCFNSTTRSFLTQSGLKSGMTVLDIGCGSGVISIWLAQQVGPAGKVIAIENDENQLNAAIREAEKQAIYNIEFRLGSAYELTALKQQFDLVYCRFVLHHLGQPLEAIKQIYTVLRPNGIYTAEEGIVNFAFSYPFTPAWGDEAVRCPPVWSDVEKEQRDGNIGVKLFHKMRSVGFNIISASIIHPLLTTHDEKALLLIGRDEHKAYHLSHGMTEERWNELGKETEKLVNNDSQIIGFYASCQVAGIKSNKG